MSRASKLTPHERWIRQELEAGKTHADIARALRVPRKTLADFAAALDAQRANWGSAAADAGEVSREEILEAELRELRSAMSKGRKASVAEERVLQAIEHAVTASPRHWDAGELLPEDPGETQHVHNLLLSDLHYGEVVDPEQVDGLNEFNVAVLEDRLASVRRSLISFQRHRATPIRKLVLSMLGDMVSGGPGIHAEIVESNELTAAEQGHQMGLLLGQFVESLVPYYEEIEVLGVSGNHPRMAKPHASKNVFDNFDWMAYRVAEVYLRAYESVACFFPRSGVLVHEIAGRNIFLFHGDGIRSSMPGVPWGGVMRRVNEIKKQYSERGVLLHGFQLGHFHQCNVVAGEVFMNGSLVGLNEYGLKNFGAGQMPTQLLLTWDAKNKRLTDASYITPN